MTVMRSAEYGVIPSATGLLDQTDLLTVYRRMCLIRDFELEAIKAVQAGRITCPVYLSLGQEAVAPAMSLVIRDYQIFTQHRCHAVYLAFGGPPERLRDELLGLPSGTSAGRAGSNCVQCHDNGLTMYGHHGFIGENVPLAVGAALGNSRPTACFIGDGAAEEDYVFAAMGFAATNKLPVLFVCEDNNLSILTPVTVRRSWSITKVAQALGMPALDVTDDPWTIVHHARGLASRLPAFINIFVCRANWHVGVGTDGPPEWDRFAVVRSQLCDMGLSGEAGAIEVEVSEEMRRLWWTGP